jgi:excisionase family DNA binding protein
MKIILGTTYYTVSDIAEQFEKSAQTVHRWIKGGKLRGTRCGNEVLFSAEDVNRFLEESRQGGDDAAPCAD